MPSGSAELGFSVFTASGDIRVAGLPYDVIARGWFIGSWTLERDGTLFATAERATPMLRSFRIHWNGGELSATPSSFFGRSFDFQMSNRSVGRITPVHAFTRRAIMDFAPIVAEEIQVFAFWMVARQWRQEQRKRSS